MSLQVRVILMDFQKQVDSFICRRKPFWHSWTLMLHSKKKENLKLQKPIWYRPNFSLQTFFQKYRNALNAKMIFFEYECRESLWVHDFFKCLVQESRIVGYRFFQETQKVHIFLSYDFTRKTPLNPRLVFYSSFGCKQIASWKTLQDFKKKYPTSLALIECQKTKKILTLKDCLQQKCGGQFLVAFH